MFFSSSSSNVYKKVSLVPCKSIMFLCILFLQKCRPITIQKRIFFHPIFTKKVSLCHKKYDFFVNLIATTSKTYHPTKWFYFFFSKNVNLKKCDFLTYIFFTKI